MSATSGSCSTEARLGPPSGTSAPMYEDDSSVTPNRVRPAPATRYLESATAAESGA